MKRLSAQIKEKRPPRIRDSLLPRSRVGRGIVGIKSVSYVVLVGIPLPVLRNQKILRLIMKVNTPSARFAAMLTDAITIATIASELTGLSLASIASIRDSS